MNKVFRIMEVFWLVVLIGMIGFTTYVGIADGLDQMGVPMILTVFCAYLYWKRRRYRINYDAQNDA